MITLEKKSSHNRDYPLNKTNITIIAGTVTTFLLSIPILVII